MFFMYNDEGDFMYFINYKKCGTCIKAKKYLQSRNVDFVDRDILDGITKEEFEKWIPNSKKNIDNFFNTSGSIYKNENYKEKLKVMTYDEKIDALVKNPMLIKRPILVHDNLVLVGFKELEYNEVGDLYGNQK